MKLYTDKSQTAKLIELGFEKPKTPISYSYPDPSEKQKEYEASLGLGPYLATVDQIEFEYAYSIGELIEMLPKELPLPPYNPPISISYEGAWDVLYGEQEDYSWEWSIWYEKKRKELIDALYDMLVKLKEEGMI